MTLVDIKIKERIGYITLTRPEKRNALSPQLVAALLDAFNQLNADAAVKIIVLKSSDKPFSAGADLAYLQEMSKFTDEENVDDSMKLKTLFEAIYTSPKITISQVEGPALAGGCGLATLVDFCFATNEASFGYTEAKIGFVPALVMVYLREKMGLNAMKEWLLTGKIYTADQAKEQGLVYSVVGEENIVSEIETFAQKLLVQVSEQSVALTKEMLRNLPYNREEALIYAANMNAKARKSEDCKRGVAAFLNKEKLSW